MLDLEESSQGGIEMEELLFASLRREEIQTTAETPAGVLRHASPSLSEIAGK